MNLDGQPVAITGIAGEFVADAFTGALERVLEELADVRADFAGGTGLETASDYVVVAVPRGTLPGATRRLQAALGITPATAAEANGQHD